MLIEAYKQTSTTRKNGNNHKCEIFRRSIQEICIWHAHELQNGKDVYVSHSQSASKSEQTSLVEYLNLIRSIKSIYWELVDCLPKQILDNPLAERSLQYVLQQNSTTQLHWLDGSNPPTVNKLWRLTMAFPLPRSDFQERTKMWTSRGTNEDVNHGPVYG
jgi:hypothetical protein